MHTLLGHADAPGHHAGHAHHHHGGVAGASFWSGGVAMVLLHVAIAFLLAAVLRWGWVWLRTLPTVARALVTPSPQWAAPLIGTNRPGTLGRADTMLLYDGEVYSRSNRGPPRGD